MDPTQFASLLPPPTTDAAQGLIFNPLQFTTGDALTLGGFGAITAASILGFAAVPTFPAFAASTLAVAGTAAMSADPLSTAIDHFSNDFLANFYTNLAAPPDPFPLSFSTPDFSPSFDFLDLSPSPDPFQPPLYYTDFTSSGGSQ